MKRRQLNFIMFTIKIIMVTVLFSCAGKSNNSGEDIAQQQVICSNCGGTGFISDNFGNVVMCHSCSGLGYQHQSHEISFTGHGACSHYDALRKERCNCTEYIGSYEKGPCLKCGHKYTEHN